MAEKDSDFLMESIDTADAPKRKQDKISYEPGAPLSLEEIKELDQKYLLQTYSRMPVAFRYGSGEFLYDLDGNEYIDFLCGIAVNNVGHAHADIVERLISQADLLWHTSNLYYNQQQAMLARAIVEINFPGKVFFCNTGTEANEAAFKLMRAYGQQQSPRRTKIIALKGGFHGRTFGSMSMTGQAKIQDGFGPLAEDIEFIEPNSMKQLESVMSSEVAGIILEPVLGEGGVLPLDNEFLRSARELCDENKSLLVLDEIQTGMGRTGQYFAYQNYGILPDALTMAKGLGAGFPIGAILVAEKHTSVLKPGNHGSTFGGNHLATAVAYEVIRLIEAQKLLENTRKMGAYLLEELSRMAASFDCVDHVRGLGLLLGVVMKPDIEARPLVARALEHNLVIGRAGDNVLRLAPPLVLRKVTADRALEKIETLFKSI